MCSALKDPRSASELVSCAVGTDPVESFKAIQALRARPTADVLRLLDQLASSKRPTERRVAAAVLSQFGWRDRNRNGEFGFRAEAVQILRSLLHDQSPEVVADAAFALGHRQDPAAISDLLALVEHSDPEVRSAVAFALGGHEEHQVLDALFVLTRDADAGVRGWATFAFKVIDADTDRIREVLAERLEDEDHDVVLEATEALALRGDVRAAQGLAVLVGGEPIQELPAAFALDTPHATKLLRAYALLRDDIDRSF